MWIYVDLWKRKLYLLEDELIVREYPIAVGADEHPTPSGIFFISEKSDAPQEHYLDVEGNGCRELGTRCISLNVFGWDNVHKIARGYAIHGTDEPDLIGTKHTRGCIRLTNDDVVDLYARAKIGATVIVQH